MRLRVLCVLVPLLACGCGAATGARAVEAEPQPASSSGEPRTEESSAAVSLGPGAEADATSTGSDTSSDLAPAPTAPLEPLRDATALPDGVVVRAEPDDAGGATLVVENHGGTRLRVAANASVEVYASGSYFHVENAMISLHPDCAVEPECVTVPPGETLRAPRWAGSAGPSPQCDCTGCPHSGAGIYRFVAYGCRDGELPGAPFRLAAPP